MLVLVVIARENFDSDHFELFNFPGRWLLRPAFLADINPCDVIMHKASICKTQASLHLSRQTRKSLHVLLPRLSQQRDWIWPVALPAQEKNLTCNPHAYLPSTFALLSKARASAPRILLLSTLGICFRAPLVDSPTLKRKVIFLLLTTVAY
jgi:hypothetical protein